ncbi:MAG TPA: ABC transporter ATP-binding protein [Acidimicrobiales bacterium]|nr:ABC transporter ATP-binding protein [Acidimicrobiales bacterium]
MSTTAADPVGTPRGGGSSGAVLEIEDLHVTFKTEDGPVYAVRGVDLAVHESEVLGVVGESGSGKSVTMLAAMGLLPKSATITGSVKFRGEELLGREQGDVRRYRGSKIAMIFQDPLTALNPVLKVGDQIAEAVLAHNDMSQNQAYAKAISLLDQVGIPQPATRASQYPHEFSGGMRQRAMIAMAISNDPEVLIADEPTTALDVTIQAQILEVIQEVQEATKSAVVFITHDLGVIARLATRVRVLYAGRSAEVGTVDDIFDNPGHPYTVGLMSSIPRGDGSRLRPIPGSPPNMLAPPSGCAFRPRCRYSAEICEMEVPMLRVVGKHDQLAACHFSEQLMGHWDMDA